MEDETNEISKILYTILIILICIVLGIYIGKTFYKGNNGDNKEEENSIRLDI